MSDLLRVLGHCLFHHYVRCWCNFTLCSIWVDHYSYLCSLFHHHPRFCFWFILFISPLIPYLQWPRFRVWYSLHIIIIHLVISSVFLHCIITFTMFTVGIFRSMAHEIFYTCCILYMRAWVLIIGYLGLVFLHFYHPITLAFVTSWVLRAPWGHDITHCVW